LPVFRTKKEAFQWLNSGQKTIDIRKGSPHKGDIAVYLCGRKVLKLRILRKETGTLREIVRLDNYRLIIPTACDVACAIDYLRGLYDGFDGGFTAYYVTSLVVS
jgi:hypothetical protein